MIIQGKVSVVVRKGICGAKHACEFLQHLFSQSVLPITIKQAVWMHRVSFWIVDIDKGSHGLRDDRVHLHNGICALAPPCFPRPSHQQRISGRHTNEGRMRSKFICYLLCQECKIKLQLVRAERGPADRLCQLPWLKETRSRNVM